jgi:hypothetical protein
MPRVLYRAIAVAATALALWLAGCGSASETNGVASKEANQIVAAARAAADSASSVHISGSTANAGGTLTLDLSLVAGRGGHGLISQNGLSFEVIRIGSNAYVKGSPAFLSRFAGRSAPLLAGKWIEGPVSTGSLASLSALTDLRQLLDTALGSHGRLTKGGTSTIDGKPVVAVKDRSKGGTLEVATTGRPYPLQISSASASGGALTFDRWNEPIALSAPSHAVDLTRLASG